MPAPTGFTLITASKIQDASGRLLSAGRVNFFPVNNLGQPVSAIAGGGGLITQSDVAFLVVDGAITTDLFGNAAQVADTTLTTPANICYAVTVTDATGTAVQGPGYGLVQPSGATWSLDNYVPIQPSQVTLQAGPPGPTGLTGPPGSSGFSGLSVVSASGTANYLAASSNDVILTSLALPYYVQVNATGDAAGRTRTVINVGTGVAEVYIGGLAPQILQPGQSITYCYNGTVWTPTENLNTYAQANVAAYTVPLNITSVAYAWTSVGSLTLPAANWTNSQPITIYNYGSYAAKVYSGNGTTLLATIPPAASATFGNIGAGVWYLAAQSTVDPNRGLNIVTATAGANYTAALTDDVILSSLVAPYYVQVNAVGDVAGTRRTVINTGSANTQVYVPGIGSQDVYPGCAITYHYNGTAWTPDFNYNTYAQVNTASYAVPLTITFVLYSYTAAGSITLSGAAISSQEPLDIYNYGSFPLAVYQSNGTTLLATIPAGGFAGFRCFTAGTWIVRYASSSAAVFGASGSSHSTGLVPDPGAAAGTVRYLREDATWVVPPAGSGGVALPSPITDYTCFGDSITVSVGATQIARGYAQRLSAYFGGIFNNLGYGGDESPDMSWKAVAYYDPKNLIPLPFVTMFIGHNDIYFIGNTANGLAKYGSALTAAIAHCAIPQDCKVFGQSATLAGSFAANTSLPGFIGGMAVTGTNNADTITFSVATTAANQPLYISWYGQDSNGGAASFSVDGSVIDTVTTQGPGGAIATVNGGTTAAWCKRYTIAAAGTHTVVIKITSATAAGNSFTFLWAGVPSGTSATPARVLVMDPVYEMAMANSSVTNAYIAVLAPIAAQFATDGLPVLHFATNSYITNALGMAGTATSAPDGTYIPASTTPGLHPNDYGHAQLAAGVASVAAPSGIPSQPTFARGYRQISGGGTAQIYNGDEVCIISGMTSVALPAVSYQREEHYLWNYGTTSVSITGYGGPWTLYPGQSMLFVNINNGFMQMFGIGTSNTTTSTKTAAYTALATDYTLRGNAAGGAFTITLPLLPITGQLLVIKKIDSSANAVTVNASGGTIDGASTQALSMQYQVLRLQCAVASSGASTWDIV